MQTILPSDGAMTRRLFAGRPPCWDGRVDTAANLLTGKRRPAADLVAFLAGADRAEETPAAPAEVDEPKTDLERALRMFGVDDPAQLPGFARRDLGLDASPAPRADVAHADVSAVRGYGTGRRWWAALLDLAWPPRMRRARATRAPHRRLARRALRTAYGLAAVAVLLGGQAAARAW